MNQFSITNRKISTIFLAIATMTIAIVVTGCGGSGNNNTSVIPATGWNQVGATFVGRTRCRDCHASLDDQYTTSAHGQNFHNVSGDVVTGNGGRCAACHTTGFQDTAAGGYDPAHPAVNLEGIGCESCHGPGSKHVASLNKKDITRVPKDQKTCWECHNPSYKLLESPVAAVNDASLLTKKPNGVAPHHPQTGFFMGLQGFNTAQMLSPHTQVPNTCVTCHLKYQASPLNGKMDHSAASLEPDLDMTQTACASCHSGRSAETPVQLGITDMLIKIGGEDPANPGQPIDPTLVVGGMLEAYSTAHNIDLNSTTNGDDPFVKAYKAARYNYGYVWEDKSRGVHNPAFAKKLLEDAIAALSN